jgi:DNA-binding response OmpR family regulator
MQPERAEKSKDVVVLKGGPFDGAAFEIDHASHAVTEIVFRSTEYFPGNPREIVYRSQALEALAPEAIVKAVETGVRQWVFRPREQTEVMARLQAQDRDIKRLDGEVNRLLAELERVKKKTQRKRK